MEFENGYSIDYDLTAAKEAGDTYNATVKDPNGNPVGYEHGVLSENGTIQGNIDNIKKWSQKPKTENQLKTEDSNNGTHMSGEEAAKKYSGTKCEYGKKQIPKYGRRKGNGGRICARNKFCRLIGKARFYPSAAQHLMSCCP